VPAGGIAAVRLTAKSPASGRRISLRDQATDHLPPECFELSSYQLEATWSLDPDAAAMLNLTEDHSIDMRALAEYGAARAASSWARVSRF